MLKRKLRVVDPQREHVKDIARRRVKAYKRPAISVVNIHGPEETRAPLLDVTEVLERADIRHQLGKK